jgi:hypothetical protein
MEWVLASHSCLNAVAVPAYAIAWKLAGMAFVSFFPLVIVIAAFAPERGVVVHPMLVDGGQRTVHVLGRLGPAPALHGQHRELGFAEHQRVALGSRGG